ncbi:hypothetical protein HZH66_011726 [Vespula vulgaris]|uniref:Uncharacterized protein n=1 Tax=Vespula vulgaris TaxID=7454 RepID=A0A834JCK0_VESVU|nr:hypothetical protein HZH66_011726 [Vespula vulgaris]
MSGVRKQVLEKQKSVFRSGVPQRNVPPLRKIRRPLNCRSKNYDPLLGHYVARSVSLLVITVFQEFYEFRRALRIHRGRHNAFDTHSCFSSSYIQMLFLLPNLQLGNKKRRYLNRMRKSHIIPWFEEDDHIIVAVKEWIGNTENFSERASIRFFFLIVEILSQFKKESPYTATFTGILQ